MQSDCCAYLRKNRRRSNNQSLECSRHWRLDLKHECGRHWRLNLEHGCLLPYEEIAREVLDPAGVADDAKAHITSSEQLIASFATRCAWPHLEHERLLSHPLSGLKQFPRINARGHLKAHLLGGLSL